MTFNTSYNETDALIPNQESSSSSHHQTSIDGNQGNRSTTNWFHAKLLLTGCLVVVGSSLLFLGGPSTKTATESSKASSSESDAATTFSTTALRSSPILGKKKKKDSSKRSKQVVVVNQISKGHDDDDKNDLLEYCEDGGYSKRTLKLAYELPFASLFKDNKGQKKYEASSVVVVDDDAYAICDSSWSISKFGLELQPFSPGNVQIGDPMSRSDHNQTKKERGEESGYEALIYEAGIFYVLRESIQLQDETYHSIVEELTMNNNDNDDEDYSVRQACSCEYEFEGASKGFEGAIVVQDTKNEMVILGLCEGNHCSESRKNDRGNGRLVAMKKVETASAIGDDIETSVGASCEWKTIRTIHIPKAAYFKDYSAISLNSNNGRVAITSQEDSQVWLGKLIGQNPETGLWDIDAIEFEKTERTKDDKKDDEPDFKLYDFPKNDQCQTIYCNIEGIHWINDEMLIAVSDKMKSKGKQDFQCFEKDQSVHVFVLP